MMDECTPHAADKVVFKVDCVLPLWTGDRWYALGTSLPSKLKPITQQSLCVYELTVLYFLHSTKGLIRKSTEFFLNFSFVFDYSLLIDQYECH
jgi:hypothetical protein